MSPLRFRLNIHRNNFLFLIATAILFSGCTSEPRKDEPRSVNTANPTPQISPELAPGKKGNVQTDPAPATPTPDTDAPEDPESPESDPEEAEPIPTVPSDDTPSAQSQSLKFELGNTEVEIRTFTKGEGPPIVVLHDDENSAALVGKKFVESFGGTLIELVHQDTHNIRFSKDGKTYEFDPAFIFSDAGIQKTLESSGEKHFSADALGLIRPLGQKILELLGSDGFFEVHNRHESESAVRPNKTSIGAFDRENTVTLFNEEGFDLLKQRGYNVNLRDTVDEGTLRTHAIQNDWTYVSVEAGQEQQAVHRLMLFSLPQNCEVFKIGYPEFIESIDYDTNEVKLIDSSVFACEDDETLTIPQRFAQNKIDLSSMILQVYSPSTQNFSDGAQLKKREMRKNFGPGRLRNENFLMAVYGNESTISENLEEVVFLGIPLAFNRKNKASEALRAVAREANLLNENNSTVKKYLKNILTKKDREGNSYITSQKWRKIENSELLSPHSFGIAVDINHYPFTESGKGGVFWAWDEEKRIDPDSLDPVPAKLVQAFERHCFIWGGKWVGYDTMHFEYRPELFAHSPEECVAGIF